jgi:hypothetical protein
MGVLPLISSSAQRGLSARNSRASLFDSRGSSLHRLPPPLPPQSCKRKKIKKILKNSCGSTQVAVGDRFSPPRHPSRAPTQLGIREFCKPRAKCPRQPPLGCGLGLGRSLSSSNSASGTPAGMSHVGGRQGSPHPKRNGCIGDAPAPRRLPILPARVCQSRIVSVEGFTPIDCAQFCAHSTVFERSGQS